MPARAGAKAYIAGNRRGLSWPTLHFLPPVPTLIIVYFFARACVIPANMLKNWQPDTTYKLGHTIQFEGIACPVRQRSMPDHATAPLNIGRKEISGTQEARILGKPECTAPCLKTRFGERETNAFFS